MSVESATRSLLGIEDSFRAAPDHKCSVGGRGMVATAFPEATNAGVEMLERDGNAVDAACAAALALCVCEPQGSGIGGQSVAILHWEGRTVAIDGSSHAPSLAHFSRFKSKSSRELGYKATTIPSTLAVLAYLNDRYGRLDWRTVVQPSVDIARRGYRLTELQATLLKRERPKFVLVPARSGAWYFYKNGNDPYKAGDLFVQRDLAETLSTIAREGHETFYRGEMAERIDADMKKHGGFLRLDDLLLIPEVVEREPVEGTYRGYVIRAFPPPGSGETLQLILAMMECVPRELFASDESNAYLMITDILHRAFIEYRRNPRNPNTFHQITGKAKEIRELAAEFVARIQKGERLVGPAALTKQGLGETTHLSVMDGDGNTVGLTQSLNLVYGSKAAAEGLGFLYNNYIEAFQHGHPGHYYNLRPGGIPWPCAVPSIVFHEGKPWIVLGSPGSQRIFSSIAQFLSGVIDRQMSICEAMKKPRLHPEQDGKLSLEAERFDPDIVNFLEAQGYRLKIREPFSFYMGAIHAVLKRQTGDGFQGVADIRRDGTAIGI
ncbi:gamma-glutamyltransferase family protein [candidate division CSSED10-310 bacterium]|uniref:Gamma-glutamyltransferase family protein n=1 Tax=candidate division CSSED10-310 bacterium TaxID=2855610 RepID=A0ABV6YXE5_UNCC1